jgi:hypothetical protein
VRLLNSGGRGLGKLAACAVGRAEIYRLLYVIDRVCLGYFSTKEPRIFCFWRA